MDKARIFKKNHKNIKEIYRSLQTTGILLLSILEGHAQVTVIHW
jgi:hypothetical protein